MSAIVSAPYATALCLSVFFYFIIYPIVVYFRDAKGLRRYPNMHPLSSISSIPFMIVAHGGARSTYLSKLHQKHAVIRTSPNTLSYGDLRAIKDIYGHNTACTKDTSYVLTAGSHYHLADVVDKHDHARKRKLLSSAYAIKNLEHWEHKVADKTARLIVHLDKCCTSPFPLGTIPNPGDVNVDYRAWTNFFTLDAIADIGLSEKLGFLDQGNDRVTGRRIDGTTYQCNFRDCLYQNARKQSLLVWPYQWYPFINKISNVIPFYGRMGSFARDWEGIPLELAHRRLERYRRGEKLDDFFQALMEDKGGNPNNLEWGEIVAEVSIMMNAGSATTAIAMTNVLYQLLKNPTMMTKLVEELDGALEDDDDEDDGGDGVVSYDKVKHLPYLRACLDESLRLFPPTPHGLPRETPPGGINILGDYIPGGVSVAISAFVAHRNEVQFPQADKYIPERWLGEQGKALQPYFLAFSAGARGCIGRNISYLEQTVVLASVLRRYGFALSRPDWEIERLETMNWLLGEMPVKVWRRERSTVSSCRGDG
ncbi:cytochrome P450 monooxygenase [Lindgomyces ingoldianus]|uniref:Cytochrome P450 monooxygenase n=1 Tax=Lindgomyces ingoldianus TaxID=673940 RepID=A0ACB6R9B8_9PLEO|nr:cytochrome P450 monooxygenase [Lindgomyces ingoldianus]KAF2475056.1 cytochrome P450 monooxygenase [Lindgomyces ingoldianus]